MAGPGYQLLYKRSVEKDLRKLPDRVRKVIVQRIVELAANPRPAGVTKLRGAKDLFRVRFTEYRIIYQVKDKEITVLIIKVGHRKDVYRDY
jgi:mRNA interferase RelE/StbE